MKRLLALLLIVCLMPLSMALSEGDVVLSGGEGAADAFEILSFGQTSDGVLQLQTRLKEVGYYTGPLSGKYAEMTRTAVRALQEAYGLSVTGEADIETQQILYAACYRPLSYNMKGDDVSRLQTRLIELGYYHGKVSGNYLDGTRAAVTNLQKDNGLPETGKADIETLELIFSDALSLPSPAPSATPAPDASVTPSASVTPGAEKTPAPAYGKKLSYGSQGNGVKTMQERLKAIGFFPEKQKTTTGFYKVTLAAVKAFQKQNGLNADGIVDEATWNAIFAEDYVPVGATPKPTAAPTPVPYFIEVDVVNQVVKVYSRDEKGEFTNIEKQFLCSTGLAATPSDVGYWVLNGRRARWCFFPKWGSHAQYWTRINSSIAFHSLIYNSNDEMDLSVKSYNKLGSRASHGCIRLTVADARWIYDNIRAGTTVWIHETAKSDPELPYSLKPGALNKNNMKPYVTATPTTVPIMYVSGKMPPQPFREMKVGSTGADVYWLQMKLKELGYYEGTVTGAYREGTKKAVRAYQKANKLGQDGIAGTQTLKSVYADEIAASKATPTPTVKPTTKPTKAPAPTVKPTAKPTKTPAPTAKPTAKPTKTPAQTASPTAVPDNTTDS